MAKKAPKKKTPRALYRDLGQQVEKDTGILTKTFYKGPAAGGPSPDRSGEGGEFPTPRTTWQNEVDGLISDAESAAFDALQDGYEIEYLYDLIPLGEALPDVLTHAQGEERERLHKLWFAAYHVGRIVERLRHVLPFEKFVMEKRNRTETRNEPEGKKDAEYRRLVEAEIKAQGKAKSYNAACKRVAKAKGVSQDTVERAVKNVWTSRKQRQGK